MEIILLENILNLGKIGDKVTVKNGYGRNYLIPQGLATIATPSAIKMAEENTKQAAHKQVKIKTEAEALAGKLKDL